MKLLNIDANAKTVKGQKRGYMTAVHDFNICKPVNGWHLRRAQR